MTERRRKTLWTILLPLAFVLTSRIVGLGREIVISAGFGLSAATDAFYQLSAVPTYLVTYITGPLATAYIAWATGPNAVAEARQLPVITRYVRHLGLAIALIFAVIAGTLAWNGPHPKIDLPAVALTALSCILVVRVGFGAVVCNARGRFAQAQGLLFANNASFVLLLGITVLTASGGRSVVVLLAGAFCSAALIAALYARHVVRRDAPSDHTDDERTLADAIRQDLLPKLLYASVETAGFLATQMLVLALAAASGTGVTSAASLAQRLCLTANGLFVNPLSNIAMVHAARRSPADQHRFALRTIIATLVALSVVAGILVAGRLWLPDLIGGTARFSRDNALLLASLIPAYALWLVAQGTSMMLSRLSFVMERARLFTVATTAGYLVANAVRFATWWHFGFAGAIAAGALVELSVALGILTAITVRTSHLAPEWKEAEA